MSPYHKPSPPNQDALCHNSKNAKNLTSDAKSGIILKYPRTKKRDVDDFSGL